MNSLTEKIRPHVDELQRQAADGNAEAESIISLYQMYVRCPSDPGAPALCEAAFDGWAKKQVACRP